MDVNKWRVHCGGGEKFITIGDFYTYQNSTFDSLPTGNNYAYYYIDDVSVVLDTTTGINEITKNKFGKLYPNPNNGTMQFTYSLMQQGAAIFELYNITGTLINTYKLQQGESNVLLINETELKNGIYFYKVIVNGEVINNEKIVIIK